MSVMAAWDVHEKIAQVLFDWSKLPIPKSAPDAVKRFKGAYPRKEGRRVCRGTACLVLFECLKPVHEDAVIGYLEQVKGWSLPRAQEYFARLDADTQISLAVAANPRKVFEFYHHWLEYMEAELDGHSKPKN